MIRKTEAIVLRVINHGDTSKIATLYSRESGRLKLIAKGVRSPRSKSLGLLQPTHHIHCVYYEKPNRELQLFKSGDLVQGFYQLEKDFNRITLAQVMVELLDRATETDEPHVSLFNLLRRSLERLNDPELPTHRTIWFFHLRFLGELGFRPETDRCGLCGNSLAPGARLGISSPGLTCLTCQSPQSTDLELSGDLVEIIRRLSDDAWEDLPAMRLPDRDRRRLWDFLWRYTHYHLESTRNMRSLAVLKQLYE